ncbi:hypothetical protein FRC03_008559 [Tulasnella sp. 419]|nr:hypothetical protein FRC03_008559 [Tulasnella sp. 419]
MLSVLSRVCALWREVVCKTPSFWTEISSDPPDQVIMMQLARSNDAPLSVQWYSRSETPILEAIANNANRWETMVAHSCRWTSSLAPGPAPLLKKFVLKNLVESPSEQVHLFHGHAPRLQELDIRAIPIP